MTWRDLVRNAPVFIDARPVYAADKFAFHLGSRPFITHAPYIGSQDRGALEAVYAIAFEPSLPQRIEYMTAAQTGSNVDEALEMVVKRLLEWFPVETPERGRQIVTDIEEVADAPEG